MRRRDVLALVGTSALPLSGCLGVRQLAPDETVTPSLRPTATPTETTSATPPETATAPPPRRLAIGDTATFADGTTLTVAAPTVQQSVLADAGAFLLVERHEDRQYVVVAVHGSADFEPGAFAVRRDGNIADPPGQRQHVEPVTRDCPGACIGLPIVTETTGAAAIVYQPDDLVRGSWDLAAETVALFGEQPWCELREAQLTDREGAVAVRFTVENVGTRDAGFRALVAPAWLADVSDPVGFPVTEGESVTETIVPPELDGLSPEEATFTHEIDEDTRSFEVGSE